MSLEKELQTIETALNKASQTASKFTSGQIQAQIKKGGDPVTQADLEIDEILKEYLLDDGQGWLSEETADDKNRLSKKRVWIVDPLDGTKEFVQGINEWCISVALVENSQVIAAGIFNIERDELISGSIETGVTLNGKKVSTTKCAKLDNADVLASRSEVKRGQWDHFKKAPFNIIPMGSVAYKLGRVAAGLSDITFTLVPKNEWDIAAGVGLIQWSGGKVCLKDKRPPTFNNEKTLVPGLIAAPAKVFDDLVKYIDSNPLE